MNFEFFCNNSIYYTKKFMQEQGLRSLCKNRDWPKITCTFLESTRPIIVMGYII